MDTLLKQNNTESNQWLQPYEKLNGLSMIDHLYNRLDGMYPHKFSSFFTDIDAIDNWKKAWAEVLYEEKITPLEVKKGLQFCLRNYDWPPSLPEFLKACRPYLEPETAFFIARTSLEERNTGLFGYWPHPAIYFAAIRLGQYEMLNKGYDELKKRWQLLLEDELSKKEWDEIPPVLKALPDYKSEKISPKTEEIINNILRKQKSTSRNYKQWAYDILNDPEGKATIALRKAQEALGDAALLKWAKSKLQETDGNATQASIKLAQTILDLNLFSRNSTSKQPLRSFGRLGVNG